MKVLLVNGSPNAEGCTYTALMEIAKTLEEAGIGWEIFQVGKKPLSGCIACFGCAETGRCVFKDRVNEFLDMAADFDGFVFGSPVHYAAMGGAVTSFMDRVFFAGSRELRLKPAAGIASARRAGTTVTVDQLNKYFLISEMPVISANYWNMVHGHSPEEVRQDEEGLQIMRVLGRNMVYHLRCQEAAAKAGITPPAKEERIYTNFIR